jgi:hypothetical protein
MFSLYLTTALFAACDQTSSGPAMPDVRVERTISDNTTSQTIRWNMSLTSTLLIFSRGSSSLYGRLDVRQLVFNNEQEASKTLSQFVEWAQTAKTHKVEPFTKKISADLSAEISSSGAVLTYYDRILKQADHFTEADIQKFAELLKQFPAAKAEFDAKLEKAKREAQLFK